jgi:hypothetical protein
VPIDEPRVQSELTRYLEDQWLPVIVHDVDGETSIPLALDRENAATLGRVSAARRVARTIYMGSAPTANAATRGIDDRRIRLGAVNPGESVAVFGDALRRLSDRSTYLYDNAGRYWFSTQPSVNRLAADRAAQQREDDIAEEIRERLRREGMERGSFVRVHAAPRSAADVPDEDGVALVILGPEVSHSSKTEQSRARDAARDILEQRGSGARRHRNMLVFLTADTDRLGPLVEAVRQHLAWRSIDADKGTLTLDSFQLNQIETKRREATETVDARIPEAWVWLLVPTQPDALGPVELPATRLAGSGSLAQRAGARLRQDGTLITQLGGVTLRLELDRHPEIWAEGEVDLRRLWELCTTYVYLSRLRDETVLLGAVRDGAGGLMWRDCFAYAAGRDEGGRYLGLVTGGRQFEPLLDGASRVVKPEVAAAQMEAAQVEAGSVVGDTLYPPPVEAATRVTDVRPEHSDPTRFFGSVHVDGGRPGPTFSQLGTEVIAHLAALDGTDVEVVVEIKATRLTGFPPDVVRTVTENANQLKFDPGSGFERE